MVDRDFSRRCHQQRVAIGWRLRDSARCEHRARSRAVLDDDRLAKRRLHRLLQQPRHDIDAATGRVADENVDRLARKIRLSLRKGHTRSKRGGPGEQVTSCQHSVYPSSCAIDELHLRNHFKLGR